MNIKYLCMSVALMAGIAADCSATTHGNRVSAYMEPFTVDSGYYKGATFRIIVIAEARHGGVSEKDDYHFDQEVGEILKVTVGEMKQKGSPDCGTFNRDYFQKTWGSIVSVLKETTTLATENLKKSLSIKCAKVR